MTTMQASHAHPVKFKGKPVYTVSEPAKKTLMPKALQLTGATQGCRHGKQLLVNNCTSKL
jgi:hypothetical protein